MPTDYRHTDKPTDLQESSGRHTHKWETMGPCTLKTVERPTKACSFPLSMVGICSIPTNKWPLVKQPPPYVLMCFGTRCTRINIVLKTFQYKVPEVYKVIDYTCISPSRYSAWCLVIFVTSCLLLWKADNVSIWFVLYVDFPIKQEQCYVVCREI